MSDKQQTPPNENPTPNPTPEKGKKKITIDMPKDLKAIYANVAFISHTPMEMMIDFAQVLPRTPRGTIVNRVIMTPVHAKMLQMALAQNIANYERQYGEIRLPKQNSPLADNFFRYTQPDGEDE